MRRPQLVGSIALSVAVATSGCGSSRSDKPAPAPTTGSATGSATGSGSGAKYAALGKRPADARRPTPPPGIEASALAVGARVPAVELLAANGTAWKLADALSKHTRVMLVFYRGDW